MDTSAFEALSDENRLAIIELLADGEKCVCDVSNALGISNALASHHLKKLRAAGLVKTRRKGAWLHCSLEGGTLADIAGQLGAWAACAGAGEGPACCSEGDVNG